MESTRGPGHAETRDALSLQALLRVALLGLAALAALTSVALLAAPASPSASPLQVPFPASRALLPETPTAAGAKAVHTVCTVGPPDCEYHSVQEAVDAAGPGDVVKIAAGTYTDLHARPAPDGYWGPEIITQVLFVSQTLTIRGGYTTTNGFAEPPEPRANPTTLEAGGKGRALFISGAISPTIEGLRLIGGDASGLGGDPYAPQGGGGVYIWGASATLSGTEIVSNTAGALGSGGGLSLVHSDAVLRNSSVHDNSAGSHGGGVHLWTSPATLRDNAISANTVITYGGGVSLVSSNATLLGNQVEANHAGWGGGVYSDSSDPTLIGNIFRGHSTNAGGGLFLGYAGWLGTTTVMSNTFESNTAGWGGGALLLYAPVDFVGNVVAGNSALVGGGTWVFSSDARFAGNEFRDNSASEDGGGLWIWVSTAPALTGNTFTGNVASRGGGFHAIESPALLTGNRFSTNAADLGGAILLEHSDCQLLNNVVTDNIATEDGAGLLLIDSDARMANTVVAYNDAEHSGDGLYAAGSAARLVHSTIARNGGGDGTGIHVASSELSPGALALTSTILVSHTTGIRVDAGSTAALEATLWGNGHDWDGEGTILTGTINLWGSPAFVSPEDRDFHISRISAAIDAGLDAGVAVDMDQDPRPTGNGFDLGADEFTASLRVRKEASQDPVTAGFPFTYTLHLTNTGFVTLTATIGDQLPAQVEPAGRLTWTALLPPDALWTTTVCVTALPGTSGLLTNEVYVQTVEGASGAYRLTVNVLPPLRHHLPLVMRQH